MPSYRQPTSSPRPGRAVVHLVFDQNGAKV
jgi:hypothetical protein